MSEEKDITARKIFVNREWTNFGAVKSSHVCVGGPAILLRANMKSIYDIVGLYVRILKQFIIN